MYVNLILLCEIMVLILANQSDDREYDKARKEALFLLRYFMGISIVVLWLQNHTK